MNSKIEKQASFEMIYPDVLTNNGSGGQNSLYKIDRILFTSSHCTISELHALPSDEGRGELDTNPFSKSK
jgi:hypothetical protein